MANTPDTGNPPAKRFLWFVRGWIAFVGFMAFSNTLQCFLSPGFVWERLYNDPSAGANELTARTYGMWTLVASVVRFFYAYSFYNYELFLLTVITFVIALAHFSAELLIYNSSLPGMQLGMISPILVSSLSIVLMLIAMRYLWPKETEEEDEVAADTKAFLKANKIKKKDL